MADAANLKRCESSPKGYYGHNYGQFTITVFSSKHLQRDRATPTV